MPLGSQSERRRCRYKRRESALLAIHELSAEFCVRVPSYLKMAETAPAAAAPPAAEPAAKAKKQPKKAAAAKKSAKKPSGPSVSELIIKAVSASKERSGVSLAALKKALAAGGYDVEKNNGRLKLAIKAQVTKGTLLQVKGSGASGSFKLNKKQLDTKDKAAKKKPAAAKPKKPAAASAKKAPKSPKKPKKAPSAAKSPKKAKKPAAAAAKSPKKAAKKPKAAPKPKKVTKSPAKKAAKPKAAAAKSPAKKKAATKAKKPAAKK